MPAQQHQRHVVELLGDAEHLDRAVAAERDDAGGPVGIEPEREPVFAWRLVARPIEVRSDHHAAGRMDARRVATGAARLLERARGPAHDVLRQPGLDPKVRWMVGQVGQHRRIRHARQRALQALAQRAVEVRDQRHDQVGLGLEPVLLQDLQEPAVREADHSLQQLQFLREAQRPAAREPQVVVVLRRDTGQLLELALPIDDVDEVHEAHVPRPSLRGDHVGERPGRGAMAAAGIEVDQVDRRHRARINTRPPAARRTSADPRRRGPASPRSAW